MPIEADPVAAAAGPEGQRLDLYRFFAHAFGVPSTERFAWLQHAEMPALLRSLWQELDCDGDFPGFRRYADYADYECTYVTTFEVGLPSAPVPLQETAHDDAGPAPQIVLENVDFYRVLGLRVEPTRFAPDHLVTQLEFLAAVRFVREHGRDGGAALARLERDFIGRHVRNWLLLALPKLAKQDPPIFPLMLSLLIAHVERRYAALA
jgi:nitrate reductase assembly molybdenum cofactor insertion protein NarJ